MDEKQLLQLKKYIDIFLRRKKLIIVCFFAAVIGGIGIYLKTPKAYQSTSVIIYQRQSVNPSRMSPDITSRSRNIVREMINTLTEQVTSRSSLEEIIKQFDLYTNAREKLPMEDVVDGMSRNIQIESDRGDTFRVSFTGGDPKKVMLVTNALAAEFIEEDLRYREQRVTETSAYVKDELSIAKEALDKKELMMRDYKLQYYNEMSQQLTVNMTRLNGLQTQYQSNQDTIQELERTKIMVQEQIAARNQEIQAQNAIRSELGLPPTIMQDEASSVQQELTALRAKYTDEHPDVKRLKKRLESLVEVEQASAEGGSTVQAGNQPPTVSVARPGGRRSVGLIPQLEELTLQLKDIGINLATLKRERLEIRNQIEKYQQWIEAAPVREAEWSALTRDYNQLNEHYQDLVSQKLSAESAETLEKKQKGSQFRIVDSAHFPEKPFEPDFRKIMLMAIALGLGLGGCIAFALDTLDTSFKEAADIDDYLGLPVICAIPYIESATEVKRKRMKTFLWSMGFVAVFLSIISSVIYLIHRGNIII